jgi:hypothetical protein
MFCTTYEINTDGTDVGVNVRIVLCKKQDRIKSATVFVKTQ